MRKKIAFITFIILLSFMPQIAAEEPAVFTLQAPDHLLEVGEAFTITVFLEPGSKPIDAFIIYNLTWEQDCFNIISVEPGWWDWLFDGGKIGEDYIKWTQAGKQTKASEKQIACTFNCIAEKGGNSDIIIEMAQAISGGPKVAVTWEPISIQVEGASEPEDPPKNNPPSGGGGGTYTPPLEEEPAQPQRETSMIMEGQFVFSSEPKEEQTVDDTDEPVNTTTSSEQNETQEEDDEDPAIPLPEIMVAVGGVIGVAAIILYIVGKKRKRPRKKEPEDGEIVIGQ